MSSILHDHARRNRSFKTKGKIDFLNLNDLSKIIPKSLHGKPINYGQGEGQVEIEATVWGIYVQGLQEYCLVYEEGLVEWPTFQNICNSILEKIRIEFGADIEFYVEGAVEQDKRQIKYIK